MSNESCTETMAKQIESVSLNSDDDDDDDDVLTIFDMPVEIFIKICEYVDVADVRSLEAACARFGDIIAGHNLWRQSIRRRMPLGAKCPPFEERDGEGGVDWRKEATDVDAISLRWREDNVVCIEPFTSQCAVIDTMLFKYDGAVCITGSRDRSLAAWNVKEIVEKNLDSNESYVRCYDSKPTMEDEAHGGWIWDLASPSDASPLLYSTSWDHTVKLWDLATGIAPVQTFKCVGTALCMTCLDEHVSFVGLFTPDVAVLDRRAGDAPVKQYRVHRRSVLSMCKAAHDATSPVVCTTSEDGTVGFFDVRAGALAKRVPLYDEAAASTIDRTVYGLKIAVDDALCAGALFVGDTEGTLHLIDRRAQAVVYSQPLWKCTFKKNKVTGLALDRGGLAVSSINGHTDIVHFSDPPNSFHRIPKMEGDLTAIDFKNHVLATAYSTPRVRFWVPRNTTYR